MERYIYIDGKRVPVSEDVYFAYKRPIWSERKRRQIRKKKEWSLEAFAEDGYDIPSDDAPIDDLITDKLLLDALMLSMDKLTDAERRLIDAIYYDEHTMREHARQNSTNHTKIIRQHDRIIGKLRDALKKYL